MSSSDIEITIDPADAAWIANVFGTDRLVRVIQAGMVRGMDAVHSKVPAYPEPRAFTQVTRASALYSRGARKVSGRKGRFWASSYRRTGTLGRSITTDVKVKGNDVTGRIGTAVSRQTAASGYASYVIGDDGEQAWMHQGRWWQLGKVVSDNAGLVSDAIGEEFEVAMGR